MSKKTAESNKASIPFRPLGYGDFDHGAGSYPSPDENTKVVAKSKPPEAKKQAELSFITTTQADSKDENTRKLVRSHVMKRHHAHLRKTKGYGRRGSNVSHNPDPNPKGILGEGRVDPFGVYPRQVFEHEHELIDFYISHFSQLIDAIQQPEYADCSTKIWFPAAIKEPMMFEALLLVGSRGTRALTGDPIHDNKIAMYKARTNRLLNDAMGDQQKATSDGAIASLLCLSFEAYHTADFDQYDVHAQALLNLVKLRGGLEKLGLDGSLAHMIRENDLACAYFRASTPYFTHSPPPRSSSITSISALSPGFLSPSILSNLSEDTLSILNDLSLVTSALTLSPIGVLPSSGPASYTTLMHAQQSLMILCTRRRGPMLLLEYPDVEEVVCLATEVYRSKMLCAFPELVGRLGGDGFVGRDIWAGLARLMGRGNEIRNECLELAVWVGFVGVLTAGGDAADGESSGSGVGVEGVGKEEWERFILGLVRELKIDGWAEIKGVLGKFLWYERKCEQVWGRVWSVIEEKGRLEEFDASGSRSDKGKRRIDEGEGIERMEIG